RQRLGQIERAAETLRIREWLARELADLLLEIVRVELETQVRRRRRDLVLLRELADRVPHHAALAQLELVERLAAQLVRGENRAPLLDAGIRADETLLLHQPARVQIGRQLFLQGGLAGILARLHGRGQQRQ